MPTDISWKNTTVKLGDLQPWQRNPRKSSKRQAEKMLESWDKFGQVQTVAIGPGMEVYDGHQRLSALLTVYGKGYEVDARQASRALSEDERERLVITLHVGATGAWDWDELVNWDANSLLSYGMDTDALKQLNTDAAALSLLLETETEEAEDENYSRKIESPVYKVTGEKPAISQLYDTSKTDKLMAAIDAAEGISEENKAFLKVAAQRHTVLDFRNIAEYYAHADEVLQTLMEDSALVIIDFGRAIELGYVQLSEEIAALYGEDYPNA